MWRIRHLHYQNTRQPCRRTQNQNPRNHKTHKAPIERPPRINQEQERNKNRQFHRGKTQKGTKGDKGLVFVKEEFKVGSDGEDGSETRERGKIWGKRRSTIRVLF